MTMMTDIKVPDTLKPEDTSNPVEWRIQLFWYSGDDGAHTSSYEISSHAMSDALVKAEAQLMHNFGSMITKIVGAQVADPDVEFFEDEDD